MPLISKTVVNCNADNDVQDTLVLQLTPVLKLLCVCVCAYVCVCVSVCERKCFKMYQEKTKHKCNCLAVNHLMVQNIAEIRPD